MKSRRGLSAARFVRKHYNNALVAISYPVADALVVRPPQWRDAFSKV